jgi:hypothetical protein
LGEKTRKERKGGARDPRDAEKDTLGVRADPCLGTGPHALSVLQLAVARVSKEKENRSRKKSMKAITASGMRRNGVVRLHFVAIERPRCLYATLTSPADALRYILYPFGVRRVKPAFMIAYSRHRHDGLRYPSFFFSAVTMH